MKTPLSLHTFDLHSITPSVEFEVIVFTFTIGPYPDTVCSRALALVRATDIRIPNTNFDFYELLALASSIFFG
jgi:hypothetical protein